MTEPKTPPPEYHATSAAINAAGAVCFSIAAAWLLQSLEISAPAGHANYAAIYAAATISFWSLQSAYHVFLHAGRQSLRFRNLDRGSTFVLIAGIFTPLIAARQAIPGAFIVPLLALWVAAAGGMVLLISWKLVPRKLTPLASLAMLSAGIAATAAFQIASGTIPVWGIISLVAGILLVLAGGAVYAIQKPNLAPGHFGFHELHHSLVLAGSLVLHVLVAALLA
ncbi:MAG: hemolysin III family protein [Candidatus Sigynarchaeota archaeon]